MALEAFSLGRAPLTSVTGDLPLSGITWGDAVRLCNELSEAHGLPTAYRLAGDEVQWKLDSDGFRLPTEAEWEYGCRAGTQGPHYGRLSEIAWTALDAREAPQRVALKVPNAFGLYDTLGNVWEWCWDYLDPARYGNYRVFRGGSWADEPWSVRASVRRGSAPDARLEGSGVRLARGTVRSGGEVQGWSDERDRERATVSGPLPLGWTPLPLAAGRRAADQLIGSGDWRVPDRRTFHQVARRYGATAGTSTSGARENGSGGGASPARSRGSSVMRSRSLPEVIQPSTLVSPSSA